MNKVIILAAVTGSSHTPSMSPYIPITPDEIADEVIRSWDAGAALAHIHVRNPETGEPVSSLDLYRKVAEKVKKNCDVALCVTTGGGPCMTAEERIAVIPDLSPELCSFNIGPQIVDMFSMTKKITQYKYPWEKEFLESTYDDSFVVTYRMLAETAGMFLNYDTKPELEVYDVANIMNINWMLREGLIKKPLYLQFVLGVPGGGMPATVENLSFLLRTAKETLGDFIWSAAGAGKHQMTIAAAALALGGNVRVGLEDSLYIRKGELAKSNADQVKNAAAIANAMGLEIASSEEAREILGLKGLGRVNF